VAVALGVACGGLLLPSVAAAQVSHETNLLLNADGTPGVDLRTVRGKGFQLFAAGDAALSGGRSTGNHGWSFSNYGDCINVLYSCQNQRMRRATGGTVALWFYNSWVAGAPPSQWVKIRNVAPSVANALGGGFTAGFNEDLTGGFVRWGPADLTLGRLFSGVASTNDGTCMDNTGFGNASVPAGIPLLAQSVCTDTWGSAGWEGARKINGEGWAAWAQTQGANFTWDFWQVPDDLKEEGFLGNLLHTYGETTDHYENILRSFGSVIPGGTGNPALQGYPLGLKIRFDAYNFAVPSVNSVKFVQALVINRSEDVWGTGVDYDSLYFGISPGDLGSAQTGTAWYDLPHMGATIHVVAGANTTANPCNDSFREPVFACAPGNGWRLGSQATIVLKSPIGDLRNKLFTRTATGTPCQVGTDPFCNPSHPMVADTFTQNRTRMCGFGLCNTYVWVSGGAKSWFGYLSGSEDLTLNGRDINAATAGQAWSTFRSPEWPNRAKFSKYQPDPTWDYDKDGVPDTLGLTSCHTLGCAGLASDTLPGGFVNLSSNVGGFNGVGPFSLGAGDTAAFVYAVIGDQDSVATMSQVNAAIDLYMNFYLAPQAPPVSQIVSTQTVAATDELGSLDPEVQVFFSDDPDNWTDPFLSKQAQDLAAAPPGTPLGILKQLNDGNPITIVQVDTLGDTTFTVLPTTNLQEALEERATDNLERIEVYKSCDGGNNFTSDGDCIGDPAVDENGVSLGLGWEAYRVYTKDSPTGIPSSFTDANVQGGRSYLYVIVGKSRGASFLLNTPDGLQTVEFAPSIRNVLSRSTSDPNVASIYVPASHFAGTIAASVSLIRPQSGTVPFTVDFSESVVGGSYTATFANRILVHRDSLAGEPVFRTIIVAEHHVTADVGGVPTDTVLIRTYSERAGADVFPFSGTGVTAAPFTIPGPPDTVRVITTYDALGFVVTSGTTPFFGTTTLTAAGTTPSSLFRLADYPGFTLSANNAVAGTFNTGGEAHVRGAASIVRLRLTAADSITPRNIVNGFMAQFQEATNLSVKTAPGGGLYELTWTGDPYGQEQGFVINRTNPAATEAEVAAALRARTVGATGLTDAETSALTGIPQPDLIAVRAPFTIRNTTFDREVRIARERRLNNRILLGSGSDTISILVPEDEWIPGDALVLIEDVSFDSTTTNGVVLTGNQVAQVTRATVTFTLATVGCNTAVRLSCNPVTTGTPGATGYNPISDGDKTRFEYYLGFKSGTTFGLEVTPPVTGGAITAINDSVLSLIRVVPNPYVIYSAYQANAADGRILFTNLPPRGTLRIYTVAGQFTQQITWEPDDLDGAGDLFFNMRTREGIDMASGLYIWVLSAPSDPTNPASPPIRKAGKFVIIRGSAQ
jgi:hypothetical protein